MNIKEAYIRGGDGRVYILGNITDFSISMGIGAETGIRLEANSIRILQDIDYDIIDTVTFDEFTKLLGEPA